MTAQSSTAAKPFGARLVEYYVSRGFITGAPPEAALLAADSHFILTRKRNMRLEIVCIIDRDVERGRHFKITPELLLQSGKLCRRNSGRINFVKMPVNIDLIEIGRNAKTEDAEHLTAYTQMPLLSRVRVASWIIDTGAFEIWSSEPYNGYLGDGGEIRRLMLEHYKQDPKLPGSRAETDIPGMPFLSYVLVCVFAIIFFLELTYGLDKPTVQLGPSVRTLLAFGGLNWTLVVDSGEWHRLLSATFLHGDLKHLILNSVVLAFAGSKLERLVGNSWFAAIYALSGICGSLMSLALNPKTLISIGASGAIMGVLAATLVLSFHFPRSRTRTELIGLSTALLVPALIPITQQTDYGAHFGGALGGAILASMMLLIWPKAGGPPRLRPVAAAAGLAALVGSAYATVPITKSYRAAQLRVLLIPPNQVPKSDADAKAQGARLVSRYPSDPRAYYFHALALVDKRDLNGAEIALRAALAQDEVLKTIMSSGIEQAIRGTLALVLVDKKQIAEAKTVARPLCGSLNLGPMGERLNRHRLCER